jgi:hypothetical protein
MRKHIGSLVLAVVLAVQFNSGAALASDASGRDPIDRDAVDAWVHMDGPTSSDIVDGWAVAESRGPDEGLATSFKFADHVAGYPTDTAALSAVTDGWLVAASRGMEHTARAGSFALADHQAGFPDQAVASQAPEASAGIGSYIPLVLAMLLVSVGAGVALVHANSSSRPTAVTR